jgi:C-terminal processing protease CtpA/Prc
MERFIADMSDGHCYGFSASIVRYGLPFRMRDTREGPVVESTHSTCSKIERGDLIKRINGKSIEEWISLQESITSCSTAKARRANAIQNMSKVMVRLEGSIPSNSITVEIDRDGQSSSFDCKMLTEEQWRQGSEINWLEATKQPGQIGLVQIHSWAPEAMDAESDKAQRYREEIDRALSELADSRALILDVRGNPGGYDWLSTYFASHFIEPPFPVYVLRYRSENNGFTNSELMPAISGGNYLAYKGSRLQQKLYVLVDERCFSATDTFLHVVSAHIKNRIALIGRPSAAGIGGPNEVGILKNIDFSVYLSQCKAFDSRGQELLEGRPETIEYPVQWARADVIADRDPDFERALELIAQELVPN